MSQQGQTFSIPIQYPQCPIQKPCEPCAMTYPAFIGWMVGMVIYYAFWGRKQYQELVNKEVERRLSEMQHSSTPVANASTLKPTEIVKRLESQLLTLMQGDKEGALRLVRQVKTANPSKSAQWCYEKAIQDLERDRH